MSERWSLRGEAEIRVVRDAHGVPHVGARSWADAYRGLGYAHGRDRGLQMLLMRILGQGRACEQLADGDDMLALDRFFRRLDFRAGAAGADAALSPQARHQVEAYCAGVNDAFARRLPWELRLLGYRHEPWGLADSLLVARLIGYVALAQSQADLERLLVEMVHAGVPAGHLEALFPGALGGLDVDLLRRVRLGERIVPAALRWSAALPRAVASNNWAIAGRRTAGGQAILANDPHLEVNRLPAVWCEAVLEVGDRYCLCATMPGLPGALLGRTDDLAWGATYTFRDAVDSWIEDCRDGHYRRVVDGAERWLPLRRREEVIRRKRHPDVTVVFHESEHGVVDGDVAADGLLLATRWSAGGAGVETVEAMLQVPLARDVREGMAALGRVETAWNWVLADRDGNIGYQMSGRMPRRRAGWRGLVPVPGWDPANDWQGVVAPEDLPREINPERGFVVTANDDLNHLGREHPITAPMGAYRAERIAALLAARDDWTIDAVQALQMDLVSPQAERFLAILRPLLPATENGAILRDWDLAYDPDSRGAALFERCYRALVAEVFGAVCGAEVLHHLLEETGIPADFYGHFDRVLLDAGSVWYGPRDRDALWRRVAADALAAPAERWGARQRVVLRHLLFGGRLPAWLGFDRGPVELRGGRATIHQGQVYRSGGRVTTFAPSYRLVTDFAAAAIHTCLAGGPSDRRGSRWYTSGVADWLAGRYKTLRPG
ncbi:MAG: penicillin acylase family protein [Candidatus Binatia bacterium]